MFDWLSGRSRDSALPEPTALQAQRAKQIQQLKIFNQNVSEVQRDVEYRVNCTVNATTISLHITLPSQFPQVKPLVRVSPPLTHPWVDEHMNVTGCPGINNFMVHSDLGKVVREMVVELKRTAPILRPTIKSSVVEARGSVGSMYTPVPSRDAQGTSGYALDAASGTSTYLGAEISKLLGSFMMPGGAISSYRMPNPPSTFPQLNDLSVAELQELTDSEEKMTALLHTLPQLEEIRRDREDICQRNEQEARDNLSKKPILEEKRKEFKEKYEELINLRQSFDENAVRQEKMLQDFTAEALIDNLKVAAAEAEEKSEAIADRFLEGLCSLDDFLKSYMTSRAQAHLRRVKEERLSQLVRDNY